jgi:sugar phosphate isomerase/epimerase
VSGLLFGYNTNGFAYHRLEDALQIIAALGYESVAITLDHHALNPYDGVTLRAQLLRVRHLLARLRHGAVIETGTRFLLDPDHKHQPTLLSDAPAAHMTRLEFIRQAVGVASRLGVAAVSFWSGTPLTGEPSAVLMHRLATACRELSIFAAGSGVRLAFEPEPGMFIDTMDKFAELRERVNHPAFGLTLDIGHLHCMGEPIVESIRRWKDNLWNVHIEDMRRGVHEHLMFGDGEIDFPPVLAALKEIGYTGGVHVELSRHSHDAVETARKALAFLKQAAE